MPLKRRTPKERRLVGPDRKSMPTARSDRGSSAGLERNFLQKIAFGRAANSYGGPKRRCRGGRGHQRARGVRSPRGIVEGPQQRLERHDGPWR